MKTIKNGLIFAVYPAIFVACAYCNNAVSGFQQACKGNDSGGN
jgi:hypothetical protein